MAKKTKDRSPLSMDAFMKKAKKDYGTDTVGFSHEIILPRGSISTGSVDLDDALNGGWQKGRIHELWGPEASGKTLLTLFALKNAQANGDKCVLIDAEHAFKPEWAQRFGIDTDSIAVMKPDTGEDAFALVEDALRIEGVGCIVIDSVSAMVPEAEAEASTDRRADGKRAPVQPGLQARMMGAALRKLTPLVSKAGVALIFINQMREKIGVMYGSPKTTSGGNALKFYASIRLEVWPFNEKDKWPRYKNGKKVGQRMKIRMVKSKVSALAKEPITVVVDFETGTIDNEGPRLTKLIDEALELEILERNKAWIKFAGEEKNFAQGMEKAISYFKDNPDDLEELKGKLKERKA